MLPALALLITGLLWASPSHAASRQLAAGDPVRAELVALARTTPTAGLPTDSRLALSRAWITGARAKVCALSRDTNGDLLVRNGQLQIKRVHFRKRGDQWDVAQAEQIALSPDSSFERACEQPNPDTVMTAAIKMMQTHPPAAGMKTKPSAAKVNCGETEPKRAAAAPSGPGVVSKRGRSLLHTAPHLGCYMGKFIVEGDKVQRLSHLPGWTLVRYIHPITEVVTVGWLKSHRIQTSTSTSSPWSSISSRLEAASPLPISLLNDPSVASKPGSP